jgi:hypothetical protein
MLNKLTIKEVMDKLNGKEDKVICVIDGEEYHWNDEWCLLTENDNLGVTLGYNDPQVMSSPIDNQFDSNNKEEGKTADKITIKGDEPIYCRVLDNDNLYIATNVSDNIITFEQV